MLEDLLVIAGSAALKRRAQEQALKREEQLRQSMEAFQRSKAAESGAATERLMVKQAPEARQQQMQAITADREKSLRDSVGAVQAFNAPGINAKPSADYKAAQEADASRIAERTRRAIEQLAAMSAPAEARRNFGIDYGRAAGEVDAANRAGANVGTGYRTDMSTVRPNPTATTLADVGMTLGSLGAFSKKKPATNVGSLEDASGNLYDPDMMAKKVGKIFSLWGNG